MKTVSLLVGLLLAGRLLATEDSTAKPQRGSRSSVHPAPAAGTTAATNATAETSRALPPLPEGVTELKFNEIFRSPIGDRGLEFTEKAQGLDGKKIRILGYMVRQGTPSPWKILLSPLPNTVCEKEYGMADELPPSVVHVHLPKGPAPIAPYTPGLLLLTGTLRLGNQTEADGRVSAIRLELDRPSEPVTASSGPR